MRNSEFYLRALEACEKGPRTTSELRADLYKDLPPNEVKAATIFFQHMQLLEKGNHIDSPGLPGPDKQEFLKASVEHKITPRGRVMLGYLRTHVAPKASQLAL